MKNFTKLSVLILSASILFTSCASTTLINSTPSGAELYINEEAVGVTPYSMTDTKIVGSCSSIRIEKEGYNEFYTTICRTEEVDGGAVVGGFFFWPAWLWAMKYKSSHYYKLTPKTGEEESLEQLLNNNQSSGSKLPPPKEVALISISPKRGITLTLFSFAFFFFLMANVSYYHILV